ncbi:MAG: AmmeMemoRadiSam system protein B, partial [Candidatus Shapirobacteria bacterium]
MGITDEFIASKSVGDCFREAVSKKFDGKLKGLIVPHAGYIYSGSVAAAGYRLMKKGDYDRVIVIGFYHGGMEEHSVKVQIPLIKYILGEEI